jgi:hypothetical protein
MTNQPSSDRKSRYGRRRYFARPRECQGDRQVLAQNINGK